MVRDGDILIPLVTIAEFEAIECNRCGQCCEGYFAPSPLEIAAIMGRYADAAVGSAELYFAGGDAAYAPVPGWTGYKADLMWFAAMAPLDGQPAPRWGKRQRYSCAHFARDADGLGACTVYARRPWVCWAFPYNEPASGFPGCTWEVEIIADGA